MRLLIVVALTLAAFLAAADVSALNDAPSKRLLRSTVSVDEQEERGVLDQLSNKFSKLILKPNQYAIRTMDNPKIAKVAKTSLLKRFKSVDPSKFNSVDDYFRSKSFNKLENYIFRLNKQDIDKQTTVAKVLSTGLGDDKAFHLFITATQSSDEAVEKSGKFFRDQLFLQWAKEGKTWDDVTKNFPEGLPGSFRSYYEGKYATLLIGLARNSQKEATRLARLERARAAANAAT